MTPEEKQKILTEIKRWSNAYSWEWFVKNIENYINAMPEESECMHGADCPICTGDWREFILETDAQIAKRMIEEYKTSLTMYKRSTTAVLDRVIDWLDKGGE